LTADANYGSDSNLTIAESKGVKLTSPVPGGKAFDPDEIGCDQFVLTDTNEVNELQRTQRDGVGTNGSCVVS